MKKLVLGLDIGITSVGWGIIDIETNDVVDCGVRLFPEGTASNNVQRREKRSARRLNRRKSQRIKDLKKLLKDNKILLDNFYNIKNPYEIRVKGLKQKLTNNELANALLSICKRRGASFNVVEEDAEKAKSAQSTKVILTKNEKILQEKNMFICEYLSYKLSNGESIRGIDNVFKSETYNKELKELLKNQELPETLNDEIEQIIFRKREYYEGPGSKKSPTPYGRYYLDGAQIKYIDLIEKMRGNCSVYPNELRAPKMAYSSDLFNFLNDLNNLSIKDKKITTEQKQELIKIINEKTKITPTRLAKFLKVELADLSGFRVNKKYEPILTEFKGYKIIKDAVVKEKLDKEIYENKNYVDKVITILTNLKGVEDRKKAFIDIDDKIFDDYTATIIANINGITGYHSLSFKAINLMIPELIESNNNQMQILNNSGLIGSKYDKYVGLKNIPFDKDAILSPVAKRAQNEALKVVNAVRKKYGELDTIVIEMARDRNSDERKKRIKDEQAYGEKLNKEIEELVKGRNVVLNRKLRHKLRLYNEQDGKCLYSGEAIDLDRLINDPSAYEIDHILPISISFDDSMSNKVVVKSEYNQMKTNMSPFQLFKSGKTKGWNVSEFESYVISLRKRNLINRKKLKYLLEKRDINKFDTMKDFINRNLVDTRYASRVILNTLSDYFKANEIDTKIHTIRGSLTSLFRKVTRINKDRDASYYHHAIDALIVAAMKKLNYLNKIFFFAVKKDVVTSRETGEVINLVNEDQFFDENLIKFIKNLRILGETESNLISISHKVDKKPNRQLFDDTLYGVRNYNGINYRMAKYKDIYGKDGLKVAELIKEGKDDKLLIKHHDEKTYRLLKEIVKEYYHDKKTNPFALYKEKHGYIRKYSKKGNGPIVKSLKYIYEKLGNHVDITKKYIKNATDPRVILLHPKPYRTDFYINKDGLYKFITIRYNDIIKTEKGYSINKGKYYNFKEKKNITDEFDFIFSLHKNEYLTITKQTNGKKLSINRRFLGTANDKQKMIEVKGINKELDKREIPMIGRSIINIEKFHVDVLGKKYKVFREDLQFEL